MLKSVEMREISHDSGFKGRGIGVTLTPFLALLVEVWKQQSLTEIVQWNHLVKC